MGKPCNLAPYARSLRFAGRLPGISGPSPQWLSGCRCGQFLSTSLPLGAWHTCCRHAEGNRCEPQEVVMRSAKPFLGILTLCLAVSLFGGCLDSIVVACNASNSARQRSKQSGTHEDEIPPTL